jgi:uncharacterized protein
MSIEFDPAKRERTLLERGLDFARAHEVFEGVHVTFVDERFDYGETRFNSLGWLDDRLVVIAWTPRGEARRVISMRKANEREQVRFSAVG